MADRFRRRLTERWAKAKPRELALLYVDGHVRPYHGRKHELPKYHVQQRGRSMPGTKDFHVNDRRAIPLLFVTAEANESLLKTLDSTLLPNVRQLVGKTRRVTIVFDREGWSPALFAELDTMEGVRFVTYRKASRGKKLPRLAASAFEEPLSCIHGFLPALRGFSIQNELDAFFILTAVVFELAV